MSNAKMANAKMPNAKMPNEMISLTFGEIENCDYCEIEVYEKDLDFKLIKTNFFYNCNNKKIYEKRENIVCIKCEEKYFSKCGNSKRRKDGIECDWCEECLNRKFLYDKDIYEIKVKRLEEKFGKK